MDETTVYRTWDESMAEMAVDLLRSEGIEARRMSDMSRSIYPFTMDGLGEIEIVVPDDDAQDALDILAARFSEGDIEELGDDELGEEFDEHERFDHDRYYGDEFGKYQDEEE